ncbi:PhzF family phenazine biosynthesis protein [Modestobacter versicolor]|uniref:PhzF family phenazine biosynthesis protein n=1 Tax=Modestobacter versicolor TaxID=429133 RepID=UPI0034DF275D
MSNTPGVARPGRRTVQQVEVLRYAAFSTDPTKVNPAGVVLDATGLTPEQMRAVAAEVGCSETASLLPGDDPGPARVRYWSPLAEVSSPFPPGGVVEDPATGAAVAALGGYLREGGHVALPAVVTVLQGADMGRPSVLTVGIPGDPAEGIGVTGHAVALPVAP